MGRRKLNFTTLFSKSNGSPTTTSPKSNPSSSPSSSPFPYWPSCNHKQTSTFRRDKNTIYKTINSVYFDSTEHSAFTHSSDEFFSASDDDSEALIRGLRSCNRLFFDPGAKTSSILNEEVVTGDGNIINPFKGSVAMAMESEDAYSDFRKSMEEMVVVTGIRDWESLERLLVWYLKVNGKENHGFIVGAFVDLLVGIGFYTSSAEIDEKDVTSCSSNSMSSMSFEIEELREGSGSC